MKENKAIIVKQLSKIYRLYDKPTDRLKEAINPFGKNYHKEFYALQDISFEINKGEMVGILGKNGSGKSTLLKILTGVLTPTMGEIQTNGKIAALLELGAGFNPELTGIENIYLNGTIMGYSKSEVDQRLQEILNFADIGDFVHQPVKMYSSGMFVRLAFAVAISTEPDILIVDEALAVGDIKFQAKCMSRIHQLKKKGVTILLVTHDINTIRTLCNKSLYLKEGKQVDYDQSTKISDMYLYDMREEINSGILKEANAINQDNDSFETPKGKNVVELLYKENEEFKKRVQQFRLGSGEVRVQEIEMFDVNGRAIEILDFNQEVKIRIHVKFYEELNVIIGYSIRDDKNTEILSSSTRQVSGKLVHGNTGEGVIVDFKTKIPLIDGNYNIQLVISMPINSKSAGFVDLVENALVFKVLERSPYKIWSKVLLKNILEINCVEIPDSSDN